MDSWKSEKKKKKKKDRKIENKRKRIHFYRIILQLNHFNGFPEKQQESPVGKRNYNILYILE